MLDELKNLFYEDTSHPAYWRMHAIFLLVMYELLLLPSQTARVAIFNGADFWFALTHKFIPWGTLIISIPLIIYYLIPLRQEWLGIKSKEDQALDASLFGAGKPPMPKMPFSSEFSIWAWSRILLEGLLFGLALFIFLKYIIFSFASWILDGDVFIPLALDANPAMASLHTNVMQNIALAFGTAFYEELIFRKGLFEWLQDKAPDYLRSPITQQIAATFLCALIFALSHYLYPFGDNFSTYSILYRFFFGVILCFIYAGRGFAVVAWTNASYQLLYFLVG